MGVVQHVRKHPYHGYVLGMLTLIYLLNQVDRYLFAAAIASPPFVTSHENGLISGPLFTLTYTIVAVLIAAFGSTWNRTRILSLALLFWTAVTFATGFTTKFYQVAITRIGQSIGEAACTPFAAGIISDYYPPAAKGAAMSVYNIGIYVGYSLAQSTGGQISSRVSWRAAYFVYGGIGFAVAILFALTVRDAVRNRALSTASSTTKERLQHEHQPYDVRKIFVHWITSPSLILFCIAGGVRNAGGYVWGYYTSEYFKDTRGVSENTYSAFMSWIPLVAGSLGVVLGGYISDRLVNRVRPDGSKLGPRGRVLVVIVSQVCAAPFAAGALLADPAPWGFLCLIPANVIGEMWVGICIAVVTDLTPLAYHTSATAIYMFIITNIGGNAPALVPYLKDEFTGHTDMPLRNALLVLYPAVYLASSFFFAVALMFLQRDVRLAREASEQAVALEQGGARAMSSDRAPGTREEADAPLLHSSFEHSE